MQAQEQAKEAAEAVQAAEGSLAVAKALADTSQPTIEGFHALDTEQAARTLELSTRRAAHATAQLKLEHAKTLYAAQLKARESLKTQLAEAKQAITETNFNNALIKKLRVVRPQVADKLWGMVLATVSKYFTQIRGISSKVTRSDKGFLVNGHFVGGGGLSGSALDSLGLAIRIALTKTFLPNTRFLVLDEASSACNEEREANMAGCVAASDFDQIIWVTHSDAIEAFANHVIQL
jgi:DNA repair exonuclease SbcCD ATPase subunit